MPYEIVKLPSKNVQKNTESDLLSTLGRGALRTAATIASTTLGAPGDILQTIGDVTTASNRYFNPQEEIPDFQSILPTSSQLQGGLEKVSSAFKPQSEHEKAYDQLVGDITSLVAPSVLGKGKTVERLGRAASALPRAAVVAGAGNLAHYFGKNIGLSGPKNEALKLGTMLLTSAGLDKGIKGVIQKNYDKAKLIPDTYMVSAKPALEQLRNMKLKLPEEAYKNKDVVKEVLDAATNSFRDGKIGFKKAWDLTKQANEHWPSVGKQGRKELDKIKNILFEDVIGSAYKTTKDKELAPLLKTAAEGIKQGNALYTDINNASKLRQWINDNLNFTKYAGGGIAAKLLGIPLKGAAAAAAIGQTGKAAFNVLEPIIRSPNVQKAYLDLLKSSAKEALPVATRDLFKLTQAIEKDFPELIEKPRKGRYEVVKL